jgi:serine protease AprX
VNSSYQLSFLLLVCLVSGAALLSDGQEDKALQWFHSESGSLLRPSPNETQMPTIFGIPVVPSNLFKPLNDATPPTIFGASVVPSFLKIGDPSSEIDAGVYDQAGIKMVYAEVGNRMNLMMDLQRKNEFKGYCGSNLPPGTYKVTIVAIDKAGNAARSEAATNLTILDPNDLNGNHVDDSLENQKGKDLRVIVLHDGNLSGADRLKIIPGSSMIVPGTKLAELAHLKGVKGVYKDEKLKVMASPGGDYPPAVARGVDDPRKGHNLKGDGVAVALVDTGADPNHKSLQDNKIIAFKDFVNNQSSPYDDNGHGTHCADLIAGNGDKGSVAPDAKLVVVKVMDRDGACYLSDAIKALDWCLENKDKYGIKVVSFSVGGEGPADGNSLLDLACNKMVDKGLVVCVAAGNSGPDPKSIVIPGDSDRVITVGAIDNRGSIFEQSSRGPAPNGDIKPDIVTLGVDIVSALSGTKDQYSSMSGTSMAVPQVSGAAALLLQARPDMKPADVKRVLLKTSSDLGDAGPDNVYGYGALNLTSALVGVEDQPDWMTGAKLLEVDLSRYNATVGDPVNIEARVSGDVKEVNTRIVGLERTMEIPLEDFDSNGIYSGLWETSFWNPGNYQVEVDLTGRYGETASTTIPFRLDSRH